MYYFKIILKSFLIFIVTIFIYKGLNSTTLSNFYLKTTTDLIINQKNKTIYTNNNFQLIDNLNQFSGEKITIWYKSLNNLSLEEIDRIEASNNIKIVNNNQSTITADKYVYNNKAGVHILIADKNHITYKDSLRVLKSKDRIEYFINKNLIVIRGNPKIIGKYNTTSPTYYNFSANLINIQLSESDYDHTNPQHNNSKNKNMVFIEAIDNVSFKENDTTIIADYAIYYKEQNQIEFYDNVTFTINSSSIKGTAAIYNLNLGYGKLISNNKDTPIKGKYQPNRK